MSEPETPTPESGSPPPPPPIAPPPPPAGGESPNRKMFLVLSYLWLLGLIPYFMEDKDPEVRWHARHGICLMIAEIILFVVLSVLTFIPYLGCLSSIVSLILWLGVLVLHVVMIVKAVGGQRMTLPMVSEYADKIP